MAREREGLGREGGMRKKVKDVLCERHMFERVALLCVYTFLPGVRVRVWEKKNKERME